MMRDPSLPWVRASRRRRATGPGRSPSGNAGRPRFLRRGGRARSAPNRPSVCGIAARTSRGAQKVRRKQPPGRHRSAGCARLGPSRVRHQDVGSRTSGWSPRGPRILPSPEDRTDRASDLELPGNLRSRGGSGSRRATIATRTPSAASAPAQASRDPPGRHRPRAGPTLNPGSIAPPFSSLLRGESKSLSDWPATSFQTSASFVSISYVSTTYQHRLMLTFFNPLAVSGIPKIDRRR